MGASTVLGLPKLVLRVCLLTEGRWDLGSGDEKRRMMTDAQGIRLSVGEHADYFCEREIGSKGDRKLPQHPSKFLRGHPFSGVRHWEATCFPGPLLETKNKASFRGLKDFRYILPSACRSYM